MPLMPFVYLLIGLSCTGKTSIGMKMLNTFSNFVFLEQDDFIDHTKTTKVKELSNGTYVQYYRASLIKWNELNKTIKMYLGDGWNVLLATTNPDIQKYLNIPIYKSVLLSYCDNMNIVIDVYLNRKLMSLPLRVKISEQKSYILEFIEIIVPKYSKSLINNYTSINYIVYVTDSKGYSRNINHVFNDIITLFLEVNK